MMGRTRDSAKRTERTLLVMLVSEALTDHGVILASFEEHVVCVATETEGVDKTGLFICRLSGGHIELIAGDFKDVNFVGVLVREEGWLKRFSLADTVGIGCCSGDYRVFFVYSPFTFPSFFFIWAS